jgi:hypothetical protein
VGCEEETDLVPQRQSQEQARRQGALEQSENETAGDEAGVICDESVAEYDGPPSNNDGREEARSLESLQDSSPHGSAGSGRKSALCRAIIGVPSPATHSKVTYVALRSLRMSVSGTGLQRRRSGD